ncbi:hypothetical protein FQR65_LT03394 [Abscondita terminalis]|nr:hypothetical protein FQR65_LT03394 [Abscondita terminalis]
MSFALKVFKFCNKGGVVTNIFNRCFSTLNVKSTQALPISHLVLNNWIYRQPDHIKPPVRIVNEIQLPNGLIWTPPKIEPNLDTPEIEDPLDCNNSEISAARLIVIRRKKMKKHKLKKLRKKLKYERAKIRQRRELKKEKEFQAGLIAQYKKAEAFSAEEYVIKKLKEYVKEPPIPFHLTDEYKELIRRKRLRLDVNPKVLCNKSTQLLSTLVTRPIPIITLPIYNPIVNAQRLKSKKSKKKQEAESEEEDESEGEIVDYDNVLVDKWTKILNVKVNSMRCDVVLKTSLHLARNKVEELFYESKIRVNGKKIFKKSDLVSEGDEIDVIKGVDSNNPKFLNVARVEILNVAPKGEGFGLRIRQSKSLTIENYEESSTAT